MEVTQKYTGKFKRDYDLVQRALDNDQKAYTELLGLYRDSLYYMLLKMVRNEDDAEDLTIEAFTKAFKNLAAYRSAYAFSTWLFKIATNNCIDFMRSRKHTHTHISIDKERKNKNSENTSTQEFQITEESLNPEERMIGSQQITLIHELLKKLPADYRQIISMRYFDNLPYAEISDKLDIPLGTVKVRIYRSKELMHGILKKHKYTR